MNFVGENNLGLDRKMLASSESITRLSSSCFARGMQKSEGEHSLLNTEAWAASDAGEGKIAVSARWVSRGCLTFADQGIFTLTNFGLNLLFARWLLPDEYGAFTIALALFFLVGALHLAVLIEPMMIFASRTSDKDLLGYLDAVLYWHWNFALAAGFLLAGVGYLCWLNGSVVLAPSLLALAVAGPLMFFLGLLRGMCYVHGEKLFLAAWSGGMYLILMSAAIACLFWRGWLSAASGICAMGGISGVIGIWLAPQLGVHWLGITGVLARRDTLARHWQYGRWSIATYAFVWIPENLPYFLLSSWGGLGSSAALRALMNFLLPLLRLQTALVPLLLTTMAQTWTVTQARLVRRLLYILSSGAIVYWIILGVFHHSLLEWLYDGQYQEYGTFLWLLGIMPLSSGVATVLSAVLRAQGRPDLMFWAHAAAASLMVTVGVGLVEGWGVAGAVSGMGMAGVITALVMWRGARQGGWVTTRGLT